MDSSKETSSLFGRRINSANCNLDDIAFSPPSSELEPYIYIQAPSIHSNIEETNDRGFQNIDSNFTSADYEISQPSQHYLGTRRKSNLLSSNCRSQDSLEQIIRENHPQMLGDFEDINSVTQSLPSTPLTTPSSTPHGSPRAGRHGLRSLLPGVDVLPWFYPGFLSQNAESNGPSKSIQVNMEEAKKSLLEASGIFNTSRPQYASGSVCGRINSSKKQRSHIISNRDMNFLAPTSM